MTFDIGLNEVCVREGVRYVITKFSGMDSLPNFLTHGAPLRARFARAGAPLLINVNEMPNCLEKATIRTFADGTTLLYSSNPLTILGLMAY